MNLSNEDRDNVIRTVLGEVDPRDPDQGRAAVTHVILNRLASGRYGRDATSVVHQRGQFEPWMTRAKQLNAIPTDSPEYQHVASIVDGVVGGQFPDPTDGATHFLDRGITDKRPGGIARLAPWANKSPMLAQIGGHSFYAPEGRASSTDNDLLDLYTKPSSKPVTPPAAVSQAQGPDQDLLDLYTKPGTAPVKRPAPQMIGNRVLDPAEVTPGATVTPPTVPTDPLLHRIAKSLDMSESVSKGTGEAFDASKQLALSGVEDYKSGNPYPSFPAVDPKTWGAGGLVKTAAGVLGMATSPITGAAKAMIGDPLTQATGNPDFGDKAALIATLPVGGGVAVGTGKGVVAGGKLAAGTAVSAGRKMMAPTAAIDRMVDTIGPENVPAVVDRLKANPRLNVMDASDPVRVSAQGLIDPDQPQAHQILATSAKGRMASAPAANNSAYSSTIGPVPDVPKLVGDLKKKAQDVGSQLIQPAVDGSKPADITSVVKYIDDQIGPRVLKNLREGKDIGVPLTQTQKDFLELRDRLRGNLSDEPPSKNVSSKMFMEPAQLHEIQSKLRYEGSTLMKGGGSDALTGGRYMEVRQRLVDALDKTSGEIPVPADHTRYYRVPDAVSGSHATAWFTTDAVKGRKIGDGTYLDVANNDAATQAKFFGGSGGKDWRVTKDPQIAQSVQPLMGNYKASLSKYRDAMHVQEAFEDGLSTLQNRPGMKGLEDRPEYLAKWASGATPEELEARRLGTRVAIDQKINSVRGAARKATDIPEIEFNREKIATLFGKPETDRLFQLMHDARDEATTNSKLIQGSKTAETLAAQKAMRPREVEPFSIKHNPVGLAGMLATAGTIHGGIVEGGALGGSLLAANVGGSLAKQAVQRVGRRMDVARNVEFSKLATATGPDNPLIDKLMNHPKVRNLPPPPSSPPASGGLPAPVSPTPSPVAPGGTGVSRRAAMIGGASVLGAAALGGGKRAVVASPKVVSGKLATGAASQAASLSKSQVSKVVEDYVKHGVFEDRLEYGIDDLMTSQGIDQKSAEALQKEIHRRSFHDEHHDYSGDKINLHDKEINAEFEEDFQPFGHPGTLATRIDDIIKGYIKKDVFHDRLEYSIGDLMKSEGMNKEEATALHREIHRGNFHEDYYKSIGKEFDRDKLPIDHPERKPPDKQSLMRDILERGRAGRPTTTLPMDLTKLQKAVFDRGNAIATENPASIGVGRLLARDVSHAQAAEKFIMPEDEERFHRFVNRPDITSGFITNAGFHIDRETAMKIARKTNQYKKNARRKKSLSAEDLDE